MDPIPTMKANQLVQQLRAAGKPVKEGFFVVAGYDAVRRASWAVLKAFCGATQRGLTQARSMVPCLLSCCSLGWYAAF